VGDGLESAVIISGSHNDEARFNPYTDRVSQDKAIADFKKPYGTGEGESTLSFLIVKDMLLTGFDAPIAQVLYLDKKMVEHNLLQAIARVNRTAKNKSRGYVVDYYGLSDYLQEALDVFSDTDVEGALVSLKDEIPELKSLHTKVIKYFKGMKLTDVDTCVSSLSDEAHRQNFEQDFRAFTKQLEVIMPDAASKPFINDAKALGRIMIAARNLYREESLNITGAGEKVRRLIEEHVRSLGIDPKIPPIQLLDGNFVDQVNSYKEPKVQASDIESAIKQHITVNIAEDPEYYKKLSERLEDIIKQHDDKWEQLVIELLELRNEISNDESKNSSPVDAVAAPFYNILKAELPEVDESMVIELTQDLYQEMKNASELVDFFNKWNEIRTLQKLIKRKLIAKGLNDRLKIKVVIDRLIELAKVKFN
jgi:type I restriction enzyme R subunit